MKTLSLNYLSSNVVFRLFSLSETKIDETFPANRFNVQGYEIRARRDEDKYGEGLIEFVQGRLICTRVGECNPKYSECLCSELTFTNKEWKYFSIYRPPESTNLSMVFEKLIISLSKQY